MTEIELLIDFHAAAFRQGPGSDEDTLQALGFMDLDQSKPLMVADIGCGSGAQTMVLAQHLNAQITAVDLFPAFLERLDKRAEQLGVQEKITTLSASMDDLPFETEAFDVIWSEGAIYNMGFEAGLQYWSKFLKPGGYIALSEITWLTAQRPPEIEAHWNQEYPQIDTASGKIGMLEDHGFSPVGYFPLSARSWLDTYYHPMEERMDSFLARHNHIPAAQAIVDSEKKEIDLYRRYQSYVSYGFYVAQKIDR